MLECNASSTDSNYWNHGYNAQYIGQNQVAYALGTSQGSSGQTYNGLVTSNIKNNPVSSMIAGAGMIGLGIATAGGAPSLMGMATGGSIGAAVNTGTQYVFNNGQINPIDTTMAGLTGALTFGTGILPGLLINTGGSLAGSAYKGENPNTGIAGAAAGSVTGYLVGGKIEGALNNKLHPWYQPTWVDLGLGVSNLYRRVCCHYFWALRWVQQVQKARMASRVYCLVRRPSRNESANDPQHSSAARIPSDIPIYVHDRSAGD